MCERVKLNCHPSGDALWTWFRSAADASTTALAASSLGPALGGTHKRVPEMLVCALAAYLTCLALDARATEPPLPTVLEKFDIPVGGDLIVVPVSVNGKPLRFIVDTGCSASAIVERHRSLLGKPVRHIQWRTLGGSAEVEHFAAPKMRLGQIELSRVEHIGCIARAGARG